MEEVQKYMVKHPTNGHQVGDVIELTSAEAENINAGEAEPRVELAADQSAPVTAAPDAPAEVEVPEGMEKAVATQEWLDANPEAAEKGVKVGDTIFVPINMTGSGKGD